MNIEIADKELVTKISNNLYNGVADIIDNAMSEVSVYVNVRASMTFWNIGKYINDDMEYQTYSAYGKKIIATLSQRLTSKYGKGYTYSALTRMMKVAQYLTALPDKQWFVDKLNRSILIAKEYDRNNKNMNKEI